ncbi:hypothetical protein ABID65_005006 [Bradyrhizobium sp. S3.9.2]|uniref:hypothetical protein n=1 Tax=unclassified Bradyrhizobium TaxID=2631580 RepID=UPI003395C067
MIDALGVIGSSDRRSFSSDDLVGGVPRPSSCSLDGRGENRGPWPEYPQLCEYGLRRPPKSNIVSVIRADQVQTAIAFLRLFRPTKRGTYSSYFLKHEAERWGQRKGFCCYVSNGALLCAALHLGLVIDEYRDRFPTSPNARIGISRRDFKKVINEQEINRHAG